MENKWHKEARKKVIKYLKKEGFEVRTSHEGTGELPLYYQTVSRPTMTSDVDIIALKDNQVHYIIEIQNKTRPKDIIGIIGAINISTIYSDKITHYPLKDIILYIVTKPPKRGSTQKDKFNMIKKAFKLSNGCLKDFIISTVSPNEAITNWELQHNDD
jgi:hypothetical protein|tara:strand:- start:166 stop:639 length:474 start_codon:yes stop_codon:yes gene_type:complete